MKKIVLITLLTMCATFANEQFGGIGVSISNSDRGVTIVDVVPGSPAFGAGLMAGDLIFAVDGQKLPPLGLEKAKNSLRGQINQPVEISAIRGDDTLSFVMRRVNLFVNNLDTTDISKWYVAEKGTYSADEISEVVNAKLSNDQELLSIQKNGKNIQGKSVKLNDNMVSISVEKNKVQGVNKKEVAEKPKAAKLVSFSDETVTFELFNSGNTIVRIVNIDGNVSKKILLSNAQKGFNSVSWEGQTAPVGNYLIHIEQNGAVSAFNAKLY